MDPNYSTELTEAIYLAMTMTALGIVAIVAAVSVAFALFSIVCAVWDCLGKAKQSRRTPIRQSPSIPPSSINITAPGHKI